MPPLLHKPFSDPFYGSSMAAEGFGNGFVGPARAVCVCFQKDMGVADLVGRGLAFANQILYLVAFFVGQANGD